MLIRGLGGKESVSVRVLRKTVAELCGSGLLFKHNDLFFFKGRRGPLQ